MAVFKKAEIRLIKSFVRTVFYREAGGSPLAALEKVFFEPGREGLIIYLCSKWVKGRCNGNDSLALLLAAQYSRNRIRSDSWYASRHSNRGSSSSSSGPVKPFLPPAWRLKKR